MRERFMKASAMLAIFLSLLIFLGPIVHVHASQATRDRLRELEGQRAAAHERVTETRNLLEGTQSEMAALLHEIQLLDEKHVDALDALDDIEYALLQTEMRIYYAELDLQAAQADRDLQYDIFRLRLRAMQEHGQIGFLEVLFQATSITDFFMLMENVRVVAAFDQEVLARMDAAQERYAQNREQLDRERSLIQSLQRTFELASLELEMLMEERKIWFYALEEDEANIEELLAIIEEEHHAINAEFGIVQRRHAAEVAEAERIRREAEAAAARAAAEARQAQLNFDGRFLWPVPSSTTISSPFGSRTNPITRRTENHTGIDISARAGQRIVAAADGYVRFSGWSGGYGNTVIIDHGGGYSTLYAHNSRNIVRVGQRVSRGDHIADIGSTGMSTGPHLHFEIRRNNTPINPMQYFGR